METSRKSSPQRSYWRYARPQLHLIILIILVLLVATYLDSTNPRLYGEISSLLQAGDVDLLISASIRFMCLTIGTEALFMASNWLINYTGEAISSRLRLDLFQTLQSMPFWFFAQKSSGQFISLFNHQLHNVHNGITNIMPKILTNVLILAMATYQLLKTDVKITGLAFVVLVPLFFVTEWFNSHMNKRHKISHEQKSQLNDSLKALLSTNAVLAQKNFGSSQVAIARFTSASDKISTSHQQMAFFQDSYPRLIYLAFAFITSFSFLSLATGASGLFGDQSSTDSSESVASGVDIGKMMELITLLTRLQRPLISLGNVHLELSSAISCFENIFHVMKEASIYLLEDSKTARTLKLSAWPGDIALHDVSFTYPTAKGFFGGAGVPLQDKQVQDAALDSESINTPALVNLNLTIKAGSKVALIGKNGSGKSTLALLLAGLHRPTQGQLTTAAHRYDTLEDASFRKLIGILDPDPFFENASIRDNLLVAKPNATLKDLELVCSLANIHNYIISTPQGYNTIIGENASRFSSGQRQRLALARLLLKKPSVLILDEVNSHLDLQTEAEIFNVILEQFAQETIVLITHRFSVLRRMDRILHLSQGRVIEDGSHSDLLESGGSYAQLYNQYKNEL